MKIDFKKSTSVQVCFFADWERFKNVEEIAILKRPLKLPECEDYIKWLLRHQMAICGSLEISRYPVCTNHTSPQLCFEEFRITTLKQPKLKRADPENQTE